MQGWVVFGIRETTLDSSGNVKIIERWRSADLGINLLTKIHDPDQERDVETKLMDVKTIDPDPKLFEIPTGYTRDPVNAPHAAQ